MSRFETIQGAICLIVRTLAPLFQLEGGILYYIKLEVATLGVALISLIMFGLTLRCKMFPVM